MKRMNPVSRLAILGATVIAMATGGGCLTRPVGQQPPTTKVSFGTTVSQQAVDKVDLLFAIDNSSSMGDKQKILAEAVPNLVEGLLNPRCVDPDGNPAPGNPTPRADPNGNEGNRYNCPMGFEPEFKPISDMHIGIVSSSLGTMGGDVCPEATPRNNDKGRLLNYVKNGTAPNLSSNNFLAWYPSNAENMDKNRHPNPEKPIATIPDLVSSFQALVEGTDQTGCGLEAQLESWYRFLVQPDPWESVTLDKNQQAVLNGVDVALLRQRADFLRPDSLVAIIVLTDEDDSSADPLAVGGQGWAFAAFDFPGSNVARGGQGAGRTAPRGTSICSQNPGAKDENGRDLCTSCGFARDCAANDVVCNRIKNDPNCQEVPQGIQAPADPTGYAGYYGPTDDDLNVRFHRMKERFGIDPQYPIQRYVDGLTKPRVPDRSSEHPEGPLLPNGRRDIKAYTNAPKCTNPLFAAKLPREPGDELCNLPRSTRSPDLIFFAVVGGVPNQLLHFDPTDPDKSRITDGDWIKILGRDPRNYDYSGIDPHMIQSVAPRPGLPPPSSTRGDNGPDPIHGREWDTNKTDLQYACTFDLPPTFQRTCVGDDPSCDCNAGGKNPPLCDNGNTQIKAKAYPTVREFQVVRALGDQGVIASLCPIQLTNPAADDYGYKPAVAAIVDRLKNALTTQCLPSRLTRDEVNKEVPCLILAQLAEPNDSCANYAGDGLLGPPPKEILDVFLEEQRKQSGGAGGEGDLSRLPVCEVKQIPVEAGQNCKDQAEIGWCYVENTANEKPAGRRCSQAIIFSAGSKKLIGARFTLQCINNLEEGVAAGDVPANP